MGFRVRRSIRLFPGVRINIGKRGVSTSIGVRGAHITVGHGKVRETVGLPGSGLSYTHTSGTHHEPHTTPQPVPPAPPAASHSAGYWVFVLLFALGIVGAIAAVYWAQP